MIQAKDLLAQSLKCQPTDLKAALQPALFVPEGMSALELLERFKENRSHTALVIDEYGGIHGLVTINDIVESIVGDIPLTDKQTAPEIIQRPDGSWLMDGMLRIDEFKELVKIEKLPDEERYQTVGGLVMTCLGHIPSAGDSFEVSGLRFEVVDMDERRVDKVLVMPTSNLIFDL
jgi:putative hemolysin